MAEPSPSSPSQAATDSSDPVAAEDPAPVADPAPTPNGEAARIAPVPLRVRVAYGAPSFAGAAMAIPIGIHLTIFYSDVVLVPLGFIALTKAISRALDALSDPLMGWASDRTRSRFGRRRPWIAVGAPLCALSFWALFSPPETLTPSTAIAWLLATYVLYYVFHTIYLIPHYGLGPEITQDYNERTRLFGWQEAFTVAGTMTAAVLPGVLKDQGGLGDRGAMTAFAVIFGLLLTLLYWNLVAQVRERRDFMERPPNPMIPGLRRVMRNRVFRILLAVYFVGSVTGAIPGMMIPYFTKYVLKPENPDAWLMLYLASYFGAGLLGMPFWLWFARRFGKKTAYLVTFVPGAIATSCLFFVGEGDTWQTWAVLVFAGSVFGARLFLGPSLQADVIDYDELHTGKRREAQYGSAWSFVTKFTVIPSMSIPLAILASVGYQPNVEQTDTVTFTIRAIFSLAPTATSVLAFAVAWLYPISERCHQRIWEGIEAHRRGESAQDPVTGKTLRPPGDRGVDEETGWFLDHFSTSELESGLRSGFAALPWRIGFWLVACSGLALAGLIGTLERIGDGDSDPGLWAVVSVVGAGLALAFAVHHGIRLRAARGLGARSLTPDAIRAHLADVRGVAATP